jgi:hypothetical protein
MARHTGCLGENPLYGLWRLFPFRKRKRRSNPRQAPGRRRRQFDKIRGGKTVIAVKFAHNFHHAIHRSKVLVRHRAIGDKQRLVEAADLKRDEFGGRARRTPRQNFLDALPDASLCNALPRGDFGNRDAGVE